MISAIENFVADDKEAFAVVAVAAEPSSCSESFERYRQVSYQHDQPSSAKTKKTMTYKQHSI